MLPTHSANVLRCKTAWQAADGSRGRGKRLTFRTVPILRRGSHRSYRLASSRNHRQIRFCGTKSAVTTASPDQSGQGQ